MFVYPKQYDVIVVGAGHAGVEAALAAARMGCQTLMLSTNLDTIGQMSCNPAIGGLGKGHLAREIDALGGEMGKVTDLTGIHFRMLNTKKGPSVRAPRAQCDKKAYQFLFKHICELQDKLDCKQAQVTRILREGDSATGVETTMETQFLGKTIIITTGTFLRGLMHVGANQQSGGRAGEAASTGLSGSLTEIGLELGRLKTGTPPRLSRRSIDFNALEIQPGEEPVPNFSYWRDQLFHVEHSQGSQKYPVGSVLEKIGGQLPCHVTYTTLQTAKLIRENLHKSPMYSGTIEGIGPRYCPSIEDKIVRFPEKERQQIFLEPEGIATEEIYVNGFSTCLPYDVQIDLVRTIQGCEHAEILRPAYAVEYDFANPTQLHRSLETVVCRNLYLAGQINGTSGYEEAGAQGLMAGINAARRTQDKDPLILGRDEAYIGVLIDDLVTKGTQEPYRMFTSRAEYRLLLRQDNADFRLAKYGYDLGLLSEAHYASFQKKAGNVAEELKRIAATRIGQETILQLLRRPENTYWNLPQANTNLTLAEAEQVEIAVKYEGYIARQEAEVKKLKSFENKRIPDWIDYATVPSLRAEARQKLAKSKPTTFGQASRISGVSPADLSILMIWTARKRPPTPSPEEVPNG